MTVQNPLLYTFPRERDSEAEPTERDPTSKAPGDNSPLPASNMFASSVGSLLMNLRGTADGQTPELILLNANRIQIWFDGNHLVEADSRRATVGKYYLFTVGEVILYKVVDIDERSAEEVSYDVSSRAKESIEGPVDELTFQHCYTLTQDSSRPYDGISAQLPRQHVERDGSLGEYMDPPPIPFVEFSDVLQRVSALDEDQQRLSNFHS